MDPLDPRHGTSRGYHAHRRGLEPACPPCLDAQARYQRGLDWDLLNGRRRMTPATGTLRRLRALVALGWTMPQLAREIGFTRQNLGKLIIYMPPDHVTVRTAAKVARLYDTRSMRLPEKTPYATRARNLARRHGWAVPLAWDEGSIDDPDARPDRVRVERPRPWSDFDPAVVERILGGEWSLAGGARSAERTAVLARWPGTLNDLERLTGWRVDRYHLPNGAA